MINCLIKNLTLLATTTGTPDFSGIITTVTIWVNAILGTLITLLVIFSLIKSIGIYFSIIRHADEPDTRAILFNALKWPLVIIVLVLLTTGLANVIILIVKNSGLSISI